MDEDEAFVCGQGAGFLKGTFAGIEIEKGGFKAGWVEVWKRAEGMLPFLAVQEDREVGKPGQAADVIEVEMGEDDGGWG